MKEQQVDGNAFFDEIEQKPMHLFVAPWRSNTALPEAWHSNNEHRKPVVRIYIWSQPFNPFTSVDSLGMMKIAGFESLMQTLAKHNLASYDVQIAYETSALLNRTKVLPTLRNADWQDGDSLVIIYYGFGISHGGSDGLIEPLLFDDNIQDPDQFSFWNTISDVAVAKSIHVAVIMDLIATHQTKHPIQITGLQKLANLVFLRSPATEFVQGTPLQDDNLFASQLSDIISVAGGKLRYDNLMSTLTLRYTQAGRSVMPEMISFGDQTLRRYIFSGVASGKSGYLLQYDPEHRWIINAGSANGLNAPSVFMDTIFQLENGKHVFVDKVFPSHCTLKSVDETETSNVFAARLVQNALPKIKVATHKDMQPEIKQRLLDILADVTLSFTEMIDDYRYAKYIITETNTAFSVSRDRYASMANHDHLMFAPVDNMEQLFQNIDSLGKWEAVLEMQNVGSAFPVRDLDVIIEPIEGIDCDPDDLDDLSGPFLINPESVTVQVRNTVDPYIKCYLPDPAKLNKYHAQFLYLDNGYAISALPVSIDTDDEDARPFASTEVHVDEFYLQRQQSEATDYLLLFLSENEMNLAPLAQFTLGHGISPAQNSIAKHVSDVFVLPDGDWTVRKIPIHIRHNTHTFEEYVRETVNNRPIIVPNDPNKNRWGGRAKKNGYILSSTVVKSMSPFQYNVSLTVRCEKSLPNSGKVAFLTYHSGFNSIFFSSFVGNEARYVVTAFEEFTWAAIIYDGTELELDLRDLPNLPEKFYSEYIHKDFELIVQKLLAEKAIEAPNDLHKNRWGGMTSANGYSLSAAVEPAGEFYLVTLTIKIIRTDNNRVENVAFLLHDSFSNPVRYKRIGNGKATCSVLSYEAFTAAAIIGDGTTLELDLNDRALGFPDAFYY